MGMITTVVTKCWRFFLKIKVLYWQVYHASLNLVVRSDQTVLNFRWCV